MNLLSESSQQPTQPDFRYNRITTHANQNSGSDKECVDATLAQNQAKAFTYQLQIEAGLATWVRNGLLSIRIAFLAYETDSTTGLAMMFTGGLLILWSVVSYLFNIQLLHKLLPATLKKNAKSNARKGPLPRGCVDPQWALAGAWPLFALVFGIIIMIVAGILSQREGDAIVAGMHSQREPVFSSAERHR